MKIIMFQNQFEPLIINKSKTTTIRQTQRNIWAGDVVSLRVWICCAYRSKTREFAKAKITRVDDVDMLFAENRILMNTDYGYGCINLPLELDKFARDDGFKSWDDMKQWFLNTYNHDCFRGVRFTFEVWQGNWEVENA